MGAEEALRAVLGQVYTTRVAPRPGRAWHRMVLGLLAAVRVVRLVVPAELPQLARAWPEIERALTGITGSDTVVRQSPLNLRT